MKIDDKNIESNVIVLQKFLNSYSAMNISMTPVTIFCFFSGARVMKNRTLI